MFFLNNIYSNKKNNDMKYIKLFENFTLPVVPEGWTKDSVDPDMIERSREASKKRKDQENSRMEKEFQEIKDNHLKFLDMKFSFPMEIDGEQDYFGMESVPENIVKLFKNAGREVYILGNEDSFPEGSEKTWIWFEATPITGDLVISIGRIPNGFKRPLKMLEITFDEEKDEFVLINEYTDKSYDVGCWFNDEVVDECLFLLKEQNK
jgi:hypothetical protein